MNFLFETFATMVRTRSQANNPALPPPDCEPRSSLPLPAELTQRILFFVSEPPIPDDRRGQRYKYAERRHCGHPPTDIRNARLACKAFADLGSTFLFQQLLVLPHPSQLDHVKYVAGHTYFSKAVRTLVYDSNTYTAADVHSEDNRKEHDRHYNAQEEILAGALDTACLQSVLPALTAVTKVICKPHCTNPIAVASGARRTNPPNSYDDDEEWQDNTRPLYNLFAALAATPTTHIRTMDLQFHISLLQDATTHPTRFSTLRTAFAPVQDLKLTILTTPLFLHNHNNDENAPTPPTPQTTTTILRTGALGTLISTARSLHRLKLNLSPTGGRRATTTPSPLHHLPLSAYIGPHDNTSSPTWPDLRYLYLGSLDVRADELLPFLLARQRISYLEFDCVTLTQGQWAAVGVVAERLLPAARTLKQHYLRQVEPKRKGVVWPEEVARELERRDVEEVGESGEWEESGYYFEAKEESSTLCMW